MKEIIFLKPVFKEVIWGGNRLKTDFLYDIPSDQTGECWAVSAQKDLDCFVNCSCFEGKSLNELWRENREIFGNISGDTFPLLIKIIDAKCDLSIQVHPDDEYANKYENGSHGKTECWYILDCPDNATIVIGHNAKSKDELANMIHNNEWDKLIREIPIKKGDFFQIESGTVHSIKGGTLLYEIQQNSNITYRMYDYGRLQHGKPRELHIKKSIDVIHCPHKDTEISPIITRLANATIRQFISCSCYTVSLIEIYGRQLFTEEEPFVILSVLDGEGIIDGRKIHKGDHFILPNGYGCYEISGTMKLMKSKVQVNQ